ncbi:hypothetical protein K458DRAFT_361895 [Lentithecium fluviatile CBS 122367]|uniref:Centromere protein H C-terminal domain-containing protein n=1 Tax=Lentithecium fluviatile CBS 122367 TaxID=1168545 RepID=A0A6G1JAM5_9PLEO|nr:hypothetical protein K458DRAFT_361895 [Lentithecium fluviatile CBS 122367]
MAAANDITMADVAPNSHGADGPSDLLETPHSDALAFSETEALALELYDQLRELELQKSLAEAQNGRHAPDASALSDDAVQEHLVTAQRELMEAKAKFEIRNRISHNVLMMDPVLKAVHGGEDTDFAEKHILPLMTEKDTLSMVHSSLTTKLASITHTLSVTEQGNIDANRANRELSRTLLELAEEMKAQSTEHIQDARLRDQVESVEKDLRQSRRRMRTLKGILSAMIVGSGLNWAADEVLRELVMDDGEDG